VTQPGIAEFPRERTTVWSFPERGDWATHRSDYRGNFAPQIPRNLMLNYSSEGELVLDPMVGGGTTLIEARLLGRNAIGYDINETAVRISRERLNFPVDNPSHQGVTQGDVRHLDALSADSIDLIITHPPYLDLVTYSGGTNPDDLSSMTSLPQFLSELYLGVAEMFRVLRPNRYCALLIGDSRRGQHNVPLSHFVLDLCLQAGFVLKEEIIKIQHNCTHSDRWTATAKRCGFYLIMHEHLFVFRKPRVGEDLARMRYSTWSGFLEARAATRSG
jgi:DNA modification methylase